MRFWRGPFFVHKPILATLVATITKLPRATVSASQVPAGIRKLTSRGKSVSSTPITDHYGQAKIIANKINATLDDVFAEGTAETSDFQVDKGWFTFFNSKTFNEKLEDFRRA